MLLWADGFDHYGNDESNMLDGLYAQASSCALATSPVATGTHCIHFNEDDSSSDFQGLRKVLPTSKTKLGVTARFYFPSLPTDSDSQTIFDFLTGSPNRSQIRCIMDANGRLKFRRGGSSSFSDLSSGTLIATTDPIVTAAAWNHIEVQLYIHASAGWIRVAVNGVHRYEATGLNTQYNSDGIVSVGQHSFFTFDGNHYMDDYIIYDFEGDSAVDTDFCPTTDGSGKATNYIGELQVMYLPPNGDTAEADFLKSSGTDGYALVDEVDPSDADYIYAENVGDLSEFALTDLPEEITYVRGLMLLGRMSKPDSGAAMIKFGMKSDAATDDADERPVTVEPTYWYDFMNVDPNSSARWTRASLNAAWFRLSRTV